MRFTAVIAITCVWSTAWAQSADARSGSPTTATNNAALDQLIPWLLDEDQQLRGVPFSEVIFDTTGKKVLPFDADNPVDQRVAKAISAACDEAIECAGQRNPKCRSNQ